MTFSIYQTTLASAVAPAGTFTFNLASPDTLGDFYAAHGHQIVSAQNDIYNSPANFTIGIVAAVVTVTSVDMNLPAGTKLFIQLEKKGQDDGRIPDMRLVADNVAISLPVHVLLGAPDALSTTAVAAAQAVAGAANLTLNGTMAVNGVVTFKEPRCLQMVSTNAGDTTQTVTVTGTGTDGRAQTERRTLNGTTVVLAAFLKAFKTITQVAVSGACAGNVSVGCSDKMGLPVFIPKVGHLVREMLDGAVATAGTLVAGDQTKPTNLTGDPRGLYTPNSAADGARSWELVFFLPDPTYKGLANA